VTTLANSRVHTISLCPVGHNSGETGIIILIMHNPKGTVFFTANDFVYHIWVLSIPITIN